MKRLCLLVVLALATASCADDPTTPTAPSTTGPIVFNATLQSSNEVPAVSNTEAGARGAVTVTMTVPRDANGAVIGGGTVDFALQLASFPLNSVAILAHIHVGAAGVNGPVVVDTRLMPNAPVVIGDGTASIAITGIEISQQLATQIVANPAGYYFNAHSPLNPGGVVRGQLTRVQ